MRQLLGVLKIPRKALPVFRPKNEVPPTAMPHWLSCGRVRACKMRLNSSPSLGALSIWMPALSNRSLR